ncbi:DNA repair protein [Psychrobacter arenosus]|uniref:DNA repair protein n=1 Tax=Psychrobacter arenosus TaxID=256326 RepID=UPI00191B1077|nr:DNA repair protein [Psychrobacter arenosus]
MAKFLSASATTYHLEHLLQDTTEQLIIVTPTLKLNERVQELLAHRDSAQAATHILYQKNHLQPTEMQWLNTLTHLRTSFCKNLQAQCYLNASEAIITSLQLHTIGQEQHNEMGVVIHRDTDTELYQETHDEVQRLLSISEAVRITIEVLSSTNKDFAIDTIKPDNNSFKPKVLEQPKASKNTVAQQSNKVDDKAKAPDTQQPTDKLKDKEKNKEKEPTTATPTTTPDKLTTAKLAKSLGLKTPELKSKLMELGYLEEINGEMVLSEAGRKTGGESRKGRFGEFCVWDAKMQI